MKIGFSLLIALLSLGCSRKVEVQSVDLIPQPSEIEYQNGIYEVEELQHVYIPQEWSSLVSRLDVLSDEVGKLSITDVEKKADLIFVLDETLAPQSYKLNISDDEITVMCSDIEGANNGVSTLIQLVLGATNGTVPAMSIFDTPRFAYRGLMIDCSRHFWTVDELKETIDQMSVFKLNKLHLHLTDNNAWRMEMEKYPTLITKGTTYKKFPELSGKYYTKQDLKDIVAYAGSRGIEIIPEIDLPGHSTALLAALPELSCNGGHFEPYPEEQDLNKRPRSNENMVCVGNEHVFTFVEDVVKDLVEIFPSKYIHLGGDEVPTAIWEKCPKCQALYKKEKMKEAGEIQDFFTLRVAEIIRSHGKTMVGWDEINDRGAATPEDVVMVWRNTGRPFQEQALNNGVPVIMVPQHGCYFDWGYAGNSTRKSYEWDPIPDSIPTNQHHLILGGQAALWTERVATQDRVEWMLYPRLCALAEVFWMKKEERNWDSFYERINAAFPMMEKLGINYYKDDAMNEKEFKPTGEKPALVRHAFIETNIPGNHPYHPEYVFDGRTNSFYWGGTSVGPKHYFSLTMGEIVKAKEIEVITGDSKDYITMADLLISSDGKNFEKIAQFDEYGQAKATLDETPIKVVKIQITGQHTCWPIIKEIIVR